MLTVSALIISVLCWSKTPTSPANSGFHAKTPRNVMTVLFVDRHSPPDNVMGKNAPPSSHATLLLDLGPTRYCTCLVKTATGLTLTLVDVFAGGLTTTSGRHEPADGFCVRAALEAGAMRPGTGPFSPTSPVRRKIELSFIVL